MKNFTPLILIAFLFLACKEKKEVKETNTSINLGTKPFYIEVEAITDEDLSKSEHNTLVLSVNGQDFNKAIKRKFKDNKVIFEGTYSLPEQVYIEYLYNVENILYMKTGIPLVLEDSIKVTYDYVISKKELGEGNFDLIPDFDNQQVVKGEDNQLNKELWVKLSEGLEGLTYSYDILDSLNAHIFPERRKKLFENYEKHFLNLENEPLKIKYLQQLVNKIEFKKKEWLSSAELVQLNRYFNELDTSYKDLNSYKLAENKLLSYTFEDDELIDFIDFSAYNTDEESLLISSYFDDSKTNIVYFWTSWCGPCHRFLENYKENYDKYAANSEYNIIFVNMDFAINTWQNTSDDYDMQWQNLYLGYDENLMFNYRFKGFPTKRVFNTKKQPIEFDFQEIDDLLKG